ncbi:MAG: metallophosphoesterase [Bacteroidetes bacterium]|nr:metallophosphoesterase [Bacteroidota bacterium]
MNRRKFIYHLAGGTAGLIALSSFGGGKRQQKITILHTNDTHSRIDPFPADDAKFPGLAGVSRRMTLIEKIRAEEEHVLLLDAGDIFQGTPYFNLYGGEIEFKMMTAMQYDAATMGNHDFDGGLEGFAKALPFAGFPFLCSNYRFENTLLDGKTTHHMIFYKGDLKIGVFGVGVELSGLVPEKLYGDTVYLDPIKVAQTVADELKYEHGCDLIICLSHLGHKPKLNKMCDPVLAAETENINLIIGGHSHTFMEKPEEHKNKAGKKVLINQVGWAGLMLGRIDFYFDKEGNPNEWACYGSGKNEVVG